MSGAVEDSPAGGLIDFCSDGVRQVCRLDGPAAGWLVTGGEADLFAVRRAGMSPSRRHHVARLPAGGLVPTSTAIGAWQLILVPLPGTELRGLSRRHLSLLERHVRLGRVADDGASLRARTAATELVAAVDLVLVTVADTLRRGQAPREASTLRGREITSLAPGSALTSTGGAWWLRSAGGQLRRNDGGPAEMSGERELLLVAERDWVVAESPCAVESHGSWDLLVNGQLRSAVDQHVARLLRMVETRIEEADAALLSAVQRRRKTDAAVLAAAA
ncbi:hypothetical protein, partial [Micromonospora sp. NPDC005220]|uniref:hypothetical protein n=1 Tax=Micromonospora sp. NPDC005220 TaxID=3155589 RepID=UPI0033AA70CD